ncbi:hypothetical protein [Geomicrobium sp. JCM 19038]|uniref:hypothetical protein n=1 Tax=Geomicrobium sp. JCM 19038 TaxID=1460635 RepID=UPI00045F2683|nr:hypothetical protein [Geomicrobium sp. JCM 19038]GAK08970.1 hypothetical protein JCM19038_2775 [Geomicrobium sp. JCM 19038]
MDIKVTVGVTPKLEEILLGLTSLAVQSNVQTNKVETPQQEAPKHQAPTEPASQTSTVPTAPLAPSATVEQSNAVPTEVPSQTAVPTTPKSYTQEDLSKAAAQLVDANKQNDLIQLLSTFGVQSLVNLPQDQYGAFATKLRELGAQL